MLAEAGSQKSMCGWTWCGGRCAHECEHTSMAAPCVERYADTTFHARLVANGDWKACERVETATARRCPLTQHLPQYLHSAEEDTVQLNIAHHSCW